jgi:hypothetical protein
MDLIVKLVLGIGLAGAVGGPYILYLAYLKPGTFPKPELARKQGLAAFIIGSLILLAYFFLWR